MFNNGCQYERVGGQGPGPGTGTRDHHMSSRLGTGWQTTLLNKQHKSASEQKMRSGQFSGRSKCHGNSTPG
eukprot:7815955-Karenia_brevis.AAC.1